MVVSQYHKQNLDYAAEKYHVDVEQAQLVFVASFSKWNESTDLAKNGLKSADVRDPVAKCDP